MKATVEFEVGSCHDCVFSREEYPDDLGYGAVRYCIYPKLDEPNIQKYYNTKTFPEWCPLIKSEEKQKNYLSEAMSQSADKIMECVRERIEQALKEVSGQQDDEIARKTIEKMKRVYKISDLKIYPENIGIFGEKIESNEEQLEKLKKDVSDLQTMVNLLQSCIHKLETKSVQIWW